MIITFSLIDVFASYWHEYQREGGKPPRERCCSWYDEFCKTKRNEEFNRDEQWNELSSARMYNFRNSIVHFFGLSEASEDLYIMLAPNDWLDAELQKYRSEAKKHKKNTVVIKPHNFHKLIKRGGMVMLKDWIDTVKASITDEIKGHKHIMGIQRVWDKINKEGAVKVLLEPKKVT